MVVLKGKYDIKKRFGKNAAKVLLYHAKLDYEKKFKHCKVKLDQIVVEMEKDRNYNADKDFIVFKWFVQMLVNSFVNYAEALHEFTKSHPDELNTRAIHILDFQVFVQRSGMNLLNEDIEVYKDYFVTEMVEKAIKRYNPNSMDSFNDLCLVVAFAQKFATNDLPIVHRAEKNIIEPILDKMHDSPNSEYTEENSSDSIYNYRLYKSIRAI